MRTYTIAAIAMLAALAAGGSAVRAADADAFAKRLFAEGLATKGKSYACFVRRYDAAHLAEHRRQKVTAMKLLVSADVPAQDKALNYSFTLGIKFRDRKGDFQSAGDCGHPIATEKTPDILYLGCGVDCDGGGISINLSPMAKSTLVEIDHVAMWNNDKPDEERDGFEAGPDDKKFRLDRAGLDECESLMNGSDEFAADQRK